MERVAFLVESSGERLSCLLNPESVVIRRSAGVRRRRSSSGIALGANLRDDPLICTGGGTTILELELLFDVSLAGSSVTTEDVRDLTRPLWNLAENTSELNGFGVVPRIYFVWGKSWTVPGVVSAVAERLESFTSEGIPRRSWLRMRLLRVEESPSLAAIPATAPSSPELDFLLPELGVPFEDGGVYELIGGGDETIEGAPASGERLDEVAYRLFGNSAYWRLLATFNDIANPLDLDAGDLLRIPPVTGSEGRR